ncbi:MAG: hypothetical protein LBU79_02060 [Planctomycetota bacterium]|nr:hypothetical protein [Planctomycetota bacterium]
MRYYKPVVLVILMAMTAASAMALDLNDVKLLVQNRVEDTVIISMLQQNPLPAYPTAQDVVDLQNLGASPSLLAFLGTNVAVDLDQQSMVVIPSNPADPVVTYPYPVYTPPQIVYAPPPPVYYYPRHYYPRRGGFSFNLNFGGGRHHGRRHHRR